MLFTLFCTVLFCLGLHLVTQDGYILDFLRGPFKRSEEYFDLIENLTRLSKEEGDIAKDSPMAVYYRFIRFVWSPFILCITCMGSIWGVTWFILLNGFSLHVLPYMVINCFASAFIQTFIWKLYAKINI